MARRKTNAERRQEWEAAERRCWKEFFPKLEAVQCLADAMRLLSEAPPPDSPGRRYYSNLGFFLQTFSAPNGASQSENGQYLRLLGRFEAEGVMKPGVLGKLEDAMRTAMAKQPAW